MANNNNKANNNKANNNKANNNNNKANNKANNKTANNKTANNKTANNKTANNNKAASNNNKNNNVKKNVANLVSNAAKLTKNEKANNTKNNNAKNNNKSKNNNTNALNVGKICASCTPQANFPNKKVVESGYEANIPVPDPSLVKHVDINLGDKYANRCVFFWAALPASAFKNGNVHPNHNKAYGDYCNRGMTCTDAKGQAHLCVEMPVVYKVDGSEYEPHVHFMIQSAKGNTGNNTNGKGWLKKQFTVAL